MPLKRLAKMDIKSQMSKKSQDIIMANDKYIMQGYSS